MKKVISLLLVVALAVTVVALVGCNGNTDAASLKFGMGVVANYGDAKSADGDTNGAGEFNTTAVAVLLDAEGKIVKIDLDTAQIEPSWTSAGAVVATEELRTKYERGTDYGMAAYGTDHNGDGVVKEWNEQADAFMATVIGKTLDEAKAYMAEDGYGTGDVATAGCTIHVTDFVAALEKAVANAVDSEATAEDTLQVALVTSASHSNKDATEDAEGLNEVDTTIVAAVVNAEGKVVVSKTDSAQGKFTFDAEGASTLDTATAVKTKLEQGTDYGMAAYGTDLNGDGVVKEWNEQAAAFDAACAGKTADEIAALVVEGYGTEALQTAGCTISVGDMVVAAVKAATVA